MFVVRGSGVVVRRVGCLGVFRRWVHSDGSGEGKDWVRIRSGYDDRPWVKGGENGQVDMVMRGVEGKVLPLWMERRASFAMAEAGLRRDEVVGSGAGYVWLGRYGARWPSPRVPVVVDEEKYVPMGVRDERKDPTGGLSVKPRLTNGQVRYFRKLRDKQKTVRRRKSEVAKLRNPKPVRKEKNSLPEEEMP